ncbi:AAA family ATPase [Roseivivax isoporae]|uniref:ATPase AAA n=1 Tax=Roseivivax isoporae LMG 25204 TaxID=1449351 RepID=X7F967_9RHOB|nr:AAA family ATPase [Roseivivax isoporae]ETX29350.1 ATPase AAA [Roseivivax isoporae LMG 25204]
MTDPVSNTADAPLVTDGPWTGLDRGRHFFENVEIASLLDRARRYVRAGVCVHFSGPAGLGKTSLALRLARSLGRPVAFMAGNDWLNAQDFIGRSVGQSMSTLVDRYVQTVRRTESDVRAHWRDSILASAMTRGDTLVYDEFTRAAPEANAILLSVLEEGVLVSTDPANPRTYLQAHPDFRVILTSNPHDYVAVNGAPDALLDRLVTFPLDRLSSETVAGIVAARSGLPPAETRRIVALVDALRRDRADRHAASMRAAILIARIIASERTGFRGEDILLQVATDVLVGRGLAATAAEVAAALRPGAAA